MSKFDDSRQDALDTLQAMRIDTTRLAPLNEQALETIRKMDFQALTKAGTDTVEAIARGVTMNAIAGAPMSKVIGDLTATLDGKFKPYAATYADTALASYDRRLHWDMFESAGITKFLYRGPKDVKTRPFCEARVGKSFTKAQIAKMDNGTKIAPVSICGGGYNCRHIWTAVAEDNNPQTMERADLVEGVHFGKIESSSAQGAERVLGQIDSTGLQDVLTVFPIKTIQVVPRIPGNLLGGYRFADRRMRISLSRPAGTYGMPWQPGWTSNISVSGATVEEAQRLSVLQELGHRVHNAADSLGVRMEGMDLISAAWIDPARKPITKYAGTDAHEYFAESFAAYFARHNDLARFDPIGSKMVKAVIDAARRLAGASGR